METLVVIVGAGPSGLAVAACLNLAAIPNVILEREDCSAPLWRKCTYDRLHLHLAKQLCHLPHMPHPTTTPTFIPKNHFIQYLDEYASKFGVCPVFNRKVESASYDAMAGRWRVAVRNGETGELEEYVGEYLVVASGENDVAVVPEVAGSETFTGDMLHSSLYKSGFGYGGKDVLVVGGGNSGTEIALDLCNSGAMTSLVVRSPLHMVTKEIWHLGVLLSKFLPCKLVDYVVLFLCYFKYGDMSKYGIRRPTKGPFTLRTTTGFYPVADVGTAQKIKSGEIQVLPSIKRINGSMVVFEDGKQHHFDAIIFATGYRSNARKWLKDDVYFIGEDGMAKQKYPGHWKGRNGLYCAGLVKRGFYGSAEDAQNIANDIDADLIRRGRMDSSQNHIHKTY